MLCAPARGQRALSRIPGQLAWLASVNVDHIDLVIPLVLAGESDLTAVRGELRKQLKAWMGSQSAGWAGAIHRRQPKIPGIAEHQLLGMNVRIPQHSGGGLGRNCQKERQPKERNTDDLHQSLFQAGVGA